MRSRVLTWKLQGNHGGNVARGFDMAIRGKVGKRVTFEQLAGKTGAEEELNPRQRLLKRILARRDAIKSAKGVLPESYPLIREDRER